MTDACSADDGIPVSGPAQRKTGAAAKALEVLAALMDAGSLTPQEICEHTGLSRTGVHRAIHALLDAGFVRYRLDRRAVLLTAHCGQRLVAWTLRRPAAVDRAASILDAVCRKRRMQADIAVLADGPWFEIVESTDSTRLSEPEAAFESDLFSAALTLYEPVAALTLTSAMVRKGGGERQITTDFMDRFRLAGRNGYLWDDLSRELTVPLVLIDGAALAIRLWSRGTKPHCRDDFLDAFATMHEKAQELFPIPRPDSGSFQHTE